MNDKRIQGLGQYSMKELFRMEAENQATILTQGLIDLEKNESSPENLESLMRASHSVKGAARMVGADNVVRIAHLMEDSFVAVQHKEIKLESGDIDLLLRAVDSIVSNAHEINSVDGDVNTEVDNSLFEIEASLVKILSKNSTGKRLKKNKRGKNITRPNSTNIKSDGENKSKVPQKKLNITYANTEFVNNERTVRIDAEHLTRMLGLSGELLVESRNLTTFSDSMLQLKKRQSELSNIFENLRGSVESSENIDKTIVQIKDVYQKLSVCQNLVSQQINEFGELDRRNTHLSTKLYNEVVASRMRPFSDCVQGLARMTRDLSRDVGKTIELEITGIGTPVDRDIVDKLKAPLNHLVRNAIDHGVEVPKLRKQSDKSVAGQIKIHASHAGGILQITVSDDGQGIDVTELRKCIVQREMAAADIAINLNEQELFEFLFLPDFSTRESVTEISGRGVGLDVVRNITQQLRGSVRINNSPGEGAQFVLFLPLTLSVVSVLIVEIAEELYAIPLSRIDRVSRLCTEDVREKQGRQRIQIGQDFVNLVSAAQVLGFEESESQDSSQSVVVVSDHVHQYGLKVNDVIGQRQLTIQALDKRLGKVQNLTGASLTEDGLTVLILDIDDVLRSSDILYFDGGINSPQVIENRAQRKRILVVEDSFTVREAEKSILESNGFNIDVAIDGVDGWNAVRRNKYDLVITDIDMPRMDGIELVNLIKQDENISKIPIMILSYKDRDEDKYRGLEAGADYYLAKSNFNDTSLMEAVLDLIGKATEWK